MAVNIIPWIVGVGLISILCIIGTESRKLHYTQGADHLIPGGGEAIVFCEKKRLFSKYWKINSLLCYLWEKIVCSGNDRKNVCSIDCMRKNSYKNFRLTLLVFLLTLKSVWDSDLR